MAGYWEDHAATERAFTPAGYYRSGDVVAIGEGGLVTFHDRVRDVVISGGMNIYPSEVEQALASHGAVRQAIVVGGPDPEWGEAVVAYVVPAGARAPAEELESWVRDRLAHYKKPRRIIFVNSCRSARTARSCGASCVMRCGRGCRDRSGDPPSPRDQEVRTMFYEIRRYHAVPGRLEDVDRRFADSVLTFFARHGIEPVAFWRTYIGPSSNEFVYVLRWDSLADREARWGAFASDPEWLDVRRRTEAAGPLVERIETALMTPTAYSPLPTGPVDAP